MRNDVVRNKETGRGYKITRFSAAYAKKNGCGRYWLALFEKDEVKALDGWYSDKLRHALEDGKNFINAGE